MAKYYPSVVVIVMLVQPLGSETQMSKNSLPPSTDVLGEETQLISSDNVHDGMDVSEVLFTNHSRTGIKGRVFYYIHNTSKNQRISSYDTGLHRTGILPWGKNELKVLIFSLHLLFCNELNSSK